MDNQIMPIPPVHRSPLLFCLPAILLSALISPLSSLAQQRSDGSSPSIERRIIEIPLPIYQKPLPKALKLTTVRPGETLEVLRKTVRGWRKARLRRSGQSFVGFVRADDLDLNFDQDIDAFEELSQAKQKRDTKSHFRPYRSVGGQMILTSMSQGGRQFSLSDSASLYQLSELRSQTLSFGLHGDFQWNRRSGLQVFLNFRRQEFEGTAVLAGATGPFASQRIQLSQDLVSTGGLVRTRPLRLVPIWLGAGVEVGKGIRLALDLSGQGRLQTSPQDFPLHFSGLLAAGGGIPLSSRWSIQSQVRAFQIFSTKPVINGFESWLSLAFQIDSSDSL